MSDAPDTPKTSTPAAEAPHTRTADEQAIIDMMERSEGRKLTVPEAEWALQQARAIGEI